MRDVTDETFEDEVLGSPVPVVVDFWAPWCRPCRTVAPIFGQLAAEHADRVAFARLNVDESVATVARYGVLTLPTAILFERGEPRETVVGARPRSHYERVWARWLGGSAAGA